jgi:hypothetical protein
MRLAQKRTVEDVLPAFGSIVTDIQPTECNNYFQNAGYASIRTLEPADVSFPRADAAVSDAR